jgi:hypothetical protein
VIERSMLLLCRSMGKGYEWLYFNNVPLMDESVTSLIMSSGNHGNRGFFCDGGHAYEAFGLNWI